MRLLLDNNLSPRLAAQLSNMYPDCTHVVVLHMDSAADVVVWQYARQNNYCLVTKDADFNELLAAKGFPPQGDLDSARKLHDSGDCGFTPQPK